MQPARQHDPSPLASLVTGSLRIAIEHYPRRAKALACSGYFDLFCYGHTHLFHAEYLHGCLLLNPVELLAKDGLPTFALVDTADVSVRRPEVSQMMSIDE